MAFFSSIERWLGLRTNQPVFFASAATVFTFVPLAMRFKDEVRESFGRISTAIATYFGWYYILACTLLLIFLLWMLWIRRYGRLKEPARARAHAGRS